MRARSARAVGLVALVTAALLGAAPTASADTVDGGTPGLLSIDADPLALHLELDPGMSGEWLLTPRLDAETGGVLELRVTSQGVLAQHPGGLRLRVDECTEEWIPSSVPGDPSTCAGAITPRLPSTAFADIDPAGSRALGTMAAISAKYLRFTVSLPDPAPAELQGGEAEFALGFAAAGDSVIITDIPVDPPGRDPGRPVTTASTGAALGAPIMLAVLLTAAGAAFTALDRRRTAR